MELRKNYRKLTTALSRFWHREAGPMNWENPARAGGQESPFPSPWMIPDRSSPSRVRFAAARPGPLRADPGDALFAGELRAGSPHPDGCARTW